MTEKGVTPGLFRCLKEGQMDFVGQHKAQQFFTIMLWVSGVVGFIYGFLTERFLYSFLVVFGAIILSGLIVVPSWPLFNRNRIPFKSVAKKD